MDEQKTTETEVENQSQTETVETTETKQPDAQGKSPFQEQLDELRKRAEEAEAALAEKDKLIENKNRAIEATKKKLKESSPEDELEARLLKRLEEKHLSQELSARIKSLTNDPAEQEVIQRHYNSSIMKTGDIDIDLKNAIAVANSDQIWEQRRNRAMEEQRENFMTGFAGSSLRGDAPSSKIRDPIHAEAAKLVGAINPQAVERLNEYFKN